MFIDFFTCVHFIMADREDEATPQVVHRQTIIHTYCTLSVFQNPWYSVYCGKKYHSNWTKTNSHTVEVHDCIACT